MYIPRAGFARWGRQVRFGAEIGDRNMKGLHPETFVSPHADSKFLGLEIQTPKGEETYSGNARRRRDEPERNRYTRRAVQPCVLSGVRPGGFNVHGGGGGPCSVQRFVENAN